MKKSRQREDKNIGFLRTTQGENESIGLLPGGEAQRRGDVNTTDVGHPALWGTAHPSGGGCTLSKGLTLLALGAA